MALRLRSIGSRNRLTDTAPIPAASQPSDNLAVFNAGGVHYAEKVEALYHMFENATNAINRDKAALYHKYIGGALIEAFD